MENEKAWGGGLARSLEQPNGDTENVYFLVFDDSHRQPQYNLGYSWTTYWLDRSGIQPGLGFTAAVIRRPDVAGGWPIPVVLPLFTLRYQQAELLSTFIPKLNAGINHGDVLYFFGKIDLK
jgi:palmitoyl transferase